MPPKRTPKRRSELRLPKSKPIPLHTRNLEKALNTMVVIYLVNNGTPLRGKLLEFDKETIVITPETTIHREKIVAFYQAQNAPAKEVPRPAVRGH